MSDHSFLSLSNHFADLVAGLQPSVVQVQGRRRPISGLVFAKDLVLTMAHVLGREERLHVRADDGRTLEAALAGWDPATSLAVLRVSDLGATPAPAATEAARVGQFAIAMGRSWSNAITVTSGLVSIIGGPLPIGHGHSIARVMRTDAAMHGGFAGGAFVDASGHVLGVTTATEIRGLTVVIPADLAWKSAAALAEHGTVKRGHLGLAGQPVALPARSRTSDERTHALLVAGVLPDSPAEAGGILVGDLIVAFDGHPVSSPVDLLALLHGDRVGRKVPVAIVRGGVPQELTVTVGEQPVR